MIDAKKECVFRLFFLSWKKIQNVFSEFFSKFELKKLRKTRSEVYIQRQNWKNRGWKRNTGDGKRKNQNITGNGR
jgi:hypothetical protein